MTDRDERAPEHIRQLAAAWRDQPVPQAGGDLAAQDTVTRDTVRWLAAAWAAQPVPPVRLPGRIARRRVRAAWRASWRPLAAAAVLILMLTVPLMQRQRDLPRAGRGTPPGVSARVPPVVVSPGQGAGTLAGPPLAAAWPAPVPDRAHLELRSGPVRLLLLNPTTTPPIEDPR